AARGEEAEDELRAAGPDGAVKTLWVTAKPLSRQGAEVTTVLGVARDMTQERAVQEQLAQLSKMESLGALAGGIAHDFNNLLTGILGYASLLQREMAPEDPLREEADQIRLAAEKASQLTSRILTFSRRSPFKPRPVDVTQTVKESVDLLTRLMPETIRFEWRAAQGHAIVEGDAVQIQQVVMNLCINARDAMPEGGLLKVEVDTAVYDDDFCAHNRWARRGRWVTISVHDTGGGIPEDVLQRMWEPFYTTKERGQGTGLGLSMVYGIVEQHAGFARVETALGKGSRFTVHLPHADVLTLGSDTGPTRVLPRGSETVMLVDDEEVVRAIARDMLAYLGYTVYVFANGEDALAHFRRAGAEIDAVVSDLVMPRLDGRSLARLLRELRPGLPIVLSTGYATHAPPGSLGEGVLFVEKPYTLEDLAVTVRQALDAGDGRDEPRGDAVV
ncbi:MAG: response regulator, partial [Candidatus Methylomirabilis sp.]|nr:response regulator [Deltaproteobacteria bacterium]